MWKIPEALESMTQRFLFFVSLALMGACFDTPLKKVRVVSPVARRVVVAETVPIMVRLPKELRNHSVTSRLDGEPTELSALVRRRWTRGGGADVIGTLPTEGLEPGWHTLRLRLESRPKDPVNFQPIESHEVLEIVTRFEFAPRKGSVTVRVLDGDGRPRHARVGVLDMDGARVHIGDKNHRKVDPSKRDNKRNSFFVIDGVGRARLPAGQYRLIISGGIRDAAVERVIAVDTPVSLDVVLPRLISTPDEVTADLHVHTAWSSDAFVADGPRFQSLAAADVDVAVITDHNRARDPRTALEILGLADSVEIVVGTERQIGPTKNGFGHANVFPLAARYRLPQSEATNLGEAVAEWRTLEAAPHFDGDTLLQLNHPRGIQFFPNKKHIKGAHAVFRDLKLDTTKPLGQQEDPSLMAPDPSTGMTLLDVDAIEIMNRFSVTAWLQTRTDWFGFMDQGWFPTGTGNSDSHAIEVERVGFPVNLVRMPTNEPFDQDTFVHAIRAGNVRVSSGPLVELRVRPEAADSKMVGSGERIDGPVAAVVIEVLVRAAPWVPVPEVRLVVNGKVVDRVRVPVERVGPGAPIDRIGLRWRLPITGDTYVLAEAGWPLEDASRPQGRIFSEVAPGHVPVGFTNPVRIDGDGDGEWTPILDPEVSLPSSVW
jgi:hypothetical protein